MFDSFPGGESVTGALFAVTAGFILFPLLFLLLLRLSFLSGELGVRGGNYAIFLGAAANAHQTEKCDQQEVEYLHAI